MSNQYISLKNLKFLLYDVLDVEKLTSHPYYQDHNREAFDMMLDSALQIGDTYMRPINEEMDRKEPQLENGKIKVHANMKPLMKTFGEGGWISTTFPYEANGMQLPITVNSATGFIFNAANYSASVFPFLGSGAAGLIHAFASDELKDFYLPKIFSGEWQGTMALTEPDAGSSLSDITTQATPTAEGHYLIEGQKIYISCGDHDACDNIVHLMLAKIKGAPAGVKGISLFVVPQKRLKDGDLESNDVETTGIFHKMGYKGAPIAHLSMGNQGDCRGWLVGEPHRGLSYMFQMMNEARIGVGMNATGIASAGYYASLAYANERPQGRKIDNKDMSLGQVPIIQHADVKRMLLFQRAVVEGSLALLLQTSYYADLEKVSEGEEKENAHLLLDFLTPIAKTYPSEMGILATSAGVQCLGGAGYCQDFPSEQFFRESRIHPIHEGTTGIHGLDLLGRKVMMKNGKASQLFLAEIEKTIAEAKNHAELEGLAQKLSEAVQKLQKVTFHLLGLAQKQQVENFMSDATLYLEMTGIIAIAWQWLKQGNVVINHSDENFRQGKLMTLRYFFAYELPKIEGLAQKLLADDFVTVEMQAEMFE